VQRQHQVPDKVPEGSGANTSRRVPVRLRRVLRGSKGLRCRYLVRFCRVPVQIPCEVPEVSGAGTL